MLGAAAVDTKIAPARAIRDKVRIGAEYAECRPFVAVRERTYIRFIGSGTRRIPTDGIACGGVVIRRLATEKHVSQKDIRTQDQDFEAHELLADALRRCGSLKISPQMRTALAHQALAIGLRSVAREVSGS
jgi:hypothetical protein